MNQILFTGDDDRERIEPKTKKQKMPKVKSYNQINSYTTNKTVDIKKIVIFFSISIIVLGFCLIGGSIYAKEQINEEVKANATPLVNINQNDSNQTIDIVVNHIRGIQEITYQWNDGEVKKINGNNQNNISESIELIGGKNILTVTVTEENGQTVRYQKEFSFGNIPTITLQNVDNGVKIISYAEDTIDYLEYSWDDAEPTVVNVGKKDYEGTITAPKGRHTLKITVVDKKGIPAEKTTTVIGATVPVIETKLGRKDGAIYFVINVEDEDQLKNVKITLNDEEIENVQVNEKTYYVEIKAIDGENRLIIEAENRNRLKTIDKKGLDTNSLN